MPSLNVKWSFKWKKKIFEMNYQNAPAFLKETFHAEDEWPDVKINK